MNNQPIDIGAAARRHGLSEDAAEVLFQALVAGGGGQAQFSHPGLGGMGQWSGGMTQIADMFNDALKSKVNAFCSDMAEAASSIRSGTATLSSGQRQGQSGSGGPSAAPINRSPWAVNANWWPSELGSPASSGSQNDTSYAFFPDKRRLALLQGGRVAVYDTGDHRLNGFSQQQSVTGSIAFSGQYGPVALESLALIDR